jgi:hypothetical protein
VEAAMQLLVQQVLARALLQEQALELVLELLRVQVLLLVPALEQLLLRYTLPHKQIMPKRPPRAATCENEQVISFYLPRVI